ncbi:MAG: excinuclease ABC subunit UvrC [Patescibacteria group bacterium]|nr:excinuclease ABC subunit UvrC [Patescibacteria group bacterium]
MDKLKQKLQHVPQRPGVYQFLGKDGEVIYIGKAKNLKSRIRQYLTGQDEREQIPYLMQEAADFSYTVVNNELESLYLENTLIKQYLPKYNILLRDDKNYAFIKIDYSAQIPQITISRKFDQKSEISNPKSEKNLKSKILNHKSTYFGPYSAAYKIRQTLNLTRRIFPYCAAAKVSSRPCFYYYLHRCPGVCIGKISLEEYGRQLGRISDFLRGNTGKIERELKTEMKLAAGKKQFEKAARLRDQLKALELLAEKQTVILTQKVNWDAVSLAGSDGYACVNLFKVRDGKLLDKENFVYDVDNLRMDESGANIIQKFLEQYYLEASSIPKIIYSQYAPKNDNLIKQAVYARTRKKIQIISPQKGKPKDLIKLGQTNAAEYLNKWLRDQAGHLDKINQALQGLKNILNLPELPRRIECYDISNIQGTNAVGSMVVFENGLPKKSEYRKFKIKTNPPAGGPDDFAMMKEMLARRMTRNAKNQNLSTKAWPIPDLIVIDGGKGQLGAALKVLQTTSYKLLPVIGLAKRIEEIFLPGQPDSIILSHDDPALQLLQRLRDEAHRFGITYHRTLRSKQAVRSALDDVPGIGPKTKKLLKAKFGTVTKIRQASFEQLSAVVGKQLAQTLRQNL